MSDDDKRLNRWINDWNRQKFSFVCRLRYGREELFVNGLGLPEDMLGPASDCIRMIPAPDIVLSGASVTVALRKKDSRFSYVDFRAGLRTFFAALDMHEMKPWLVFGFRCAADFTDEYFRYVDLIQKTRSVDCRYFGPENLSKLRSCVQLGLSVMGV